MVNDLTSDATIAEQVETHVQTTPQPRRLEILHELHGDVLLLDDDKPANYAEAMMEPDSDKWQSVMRSETESTEDNQVWDLVDQDP